MARIHQITHDQELVSRKVNFFADYFAFAAWAIGNTDQVEVENILSLTDKIIFQITTNISHCAKYIDSYLTHDSFQKNNKYLKDNKLFKQLQSLIAEYVVQKKPLKKQNWIESKPEFLRTFQKFRRSLQRTMFKDALRSTISYLRCVHDIEEHKTDLINFTNVIVSEFVLNDRSKKDIERTFERIIPREIESFPFPNSLKTIKEKEEFLRNRTFEQQFDGIYHLLKEQLSKNFFIFRVYGLSPAENFSFTYFKVAFYSPKNIKFQYLLKKVKEQQLISDFLNSQENLLLAVIKAEYNSIDVAANYAIETIRKELQFINKVFNTNCHLDNFFYLLTTDFKDFGWHKDFRQDGYKLRGNDVNKLNDNPYNHLKRAPKHLKVPILKNESLYIDALLNKNVATFWQYLETIIPTNQNDTKQVVDIASSLLLLNADAYIKNRLKEYIVSAISPLSVSAKQLGITTKRQLELINNPHSIDWGRLKNEITHPFINHLIHYRQRVVTKKDLQDRKAQYRRILWDAQAQRNSIIHGGFAQDKAMLSLNATLPRLVMRLRWVIFDGIKREINSSYEGIIYELKEQAKSLI